MGLVKKMWIAQVMLLLLCLTSCHRSESDVWEDTRTCSRYMGYGLRSLGGKHDYSRQVCSPDEFCSENAPDDFCLFEDEGFQGNDFSLSEVAYPQARELPGDPGSSIPSIHAFSDPSLHPELAAIFKTVHFDYDSSLVKGDANLQTIHSIAQYMQSHRNTFAVIEGHTDERGPAAYNMALGSQRANAVRAALIDQGASPDALFTISYGKERPVVMEHHEDGWRQNRRAEFKIHQR